MILNIVLIGDSGHSKVITDCINSMTDYKVVAKLDDKHCKKNLLNGIIKGPLALFEEIRNEFTAKTIICIGGNDIRKNIVERLKLTENDYISIVHNNAKISDSAIIGVGTVVMPGVIINADAIVGNHVIINSNSVIEHDCIVEDFVHVSPGSIITGGVIIGEGSHIGAGSTIIPLKSVGKWSIVGAGSVIVTDIEDRVTAVGVPGKVIKREGL